MGNEAHIVPLGDLVAHELEADCPCGPAREMAWIDDGPGWVVIHHALDGRPDPRDV